MITDVIVGAIDTMIDLCSDADQKLGMLSLREMLCDLDVDHWYAMTSEEEREWLSQFLSCSPAAVSFSSEDKLSSEMIRSCQQNRFDYSKFSVADLEKMEQSAYADYYKLATNPRTNPTKEDLEQLEKATAKWEAISEELRSRKPSLNAQIQFASELASTSQSVPHVISKAQEPEI